jgi:hypothetical protein
VEGNEQTDRAAKQAAAKSLPPQDSGELSLAHARRGLTETRTKKHQSWREKMMGRRSLEIQRSYRKNKGFQQDPAVAGAPKRIASRYYQLKTGHAPVGVFLQRIKVQEGASCQWCQAPRESVRHLMLECQQWTAQQWKFRRDLA